MSWRFEISSECDCQASLSFSANGWEIYITEEHFDDGPAWFLRGIHREQRRDERRIIRDLREAMNEAERLTQGVLF